MSSTLNSATVIALLKIHSAGIDQSVEMRDGDRFFVGSDERSDICVEAANVAPTHCLIAAKFGSLTIEDCYSPVGTFVSDQKIRSLQLTGNADIRVGDAVIKVRFPNVPGQPWNLSESSPETESAALKMPALPMNSQLPQQPTAPTGVPMFDPTDLSYDNVALSARSGAGGVTDTAFTARDPQDANHLPSSLQPTNDAAAPDQQAVLTELRWKLVQLEEENRSLEQQLASLSQVSVETHADADPFHE